MPLGPPGEGRQATLTLKTPTPYGADLPEVSHRAKGRDRDDEWTSVDDVEAFLR